MFELKQKNNCIFYIGICITYKLMYIFAQAITKTDRQMHYDFTSLPKTRAEVTDWYNYVKVPCITEGHANQHIFDQEQGAKYLQDKAAKFATEKDFQDWRDMYSKAVASFCDQYSA